MIERLASLPVWQKVLGVLLFLLMAYLFYRSVSFWMSLKKLKLKDRFAIRNEFIKTTAQILGGAFFLITIYFTYQNLALSQKNLVATQEKNITDLYVKAIAQLGKKESLEVRLGGIYALERISRESEKDYWPIMQVLTAYVRQHATCEEDQLQIEGIAHAKLSSDIEAVLEVIHRRQHSFGFGESERLDLSRTNICKTNFIETNLEMAILFKANLQGALLRGAQMKGAMLGEANLKGAYMEKADISGAYLVRANLWNARLHGSILNKADLNGAKLWGTNLEEADLQDANLNGASLCGANLKGAKLSGAILERADLTKTNLIGVDLKDAKGLTREQLATAFVDKTTNLPDYLHEPATEKTNNKLR